MPSWAGVATKPPRAALLLVSRRSARPGSATERTWQRARHSPCAGTAQEDVPLQSKRSVPLGKENKEAQKISYRETYTPAWPQTHYGEDDP